MDKPAYQFSVEPVADVMDDALRLQRILRAHEVIRADEPTAEGLDLAERSGVVTTVARVNGKVAGMCWFRRAHDGAADCGMAIYPEFRGQVAVMRWAHFVELVAHAVGAKWFTWELQPSSEPFGVFRKDAVKVSTKYLVRLSEPEGVAP